MELRNLQKLLDSGEELRGKRALVRVDLNVPMYHGKVSDNTRIIRSIPTINALRERGAKVVLISHFGRPKAGYETEFSLAPIADALATALGSDVKFAVDCVGSSAEQSVNALEAGDVLLLENVRFHKGEVDNDAQFIVQLAQLGDFFISEAFSCAHRAHASVEGIAHALPSFAGFAFTQEIESLQAAMGNPVRPVGAIVGGAKVSTKIDMLRCLVSKMDDIFIGGGMANTFIAAAGHDVGKSLYEADYLDTAREVLAQAQKHGCTLHIPRDVVVAEEFTPYPPCRIALIDDIKDDEMALDVGPQTVVAWSQRMSELKTLVWNGPLGAFETPPFDVATQAVSRTIAGRCADGDMTVVAGGGDVLAALAKSCVREHLSYVSTAGGAFLEWLEGKELPGVAVLQGEQNMHDV